MVIDRDATTEVVRTNDLPFKLIGSLAASCFVGALVMDIVYAFSPDFMWVTFSVWLVTVGLVVAGLATVVGLIDRIVHKRLRAVADDWPRLLGFAAVVVVSLFNAFVHSRDAWQAVVPDGLVLSALAVVLLLVTLISGRSLARRHPTKARL